VLEENKNKNWAAECKTPSGWTEKRDVIEKKKDIEREKRRRGLNALPAIHRFLVEFIFVSCVFVFMAGAWVAQVGKK